VGRILVAEDDEDLRELAYIGLSREGHQVVLAVDGQHAIDLVAASTDPFDAIVLDVAMPRMTGVEVVRRLRADPATERIPIVMLTAAIGDRPTEAAFAAGADEYVTKPYRLRELARRVTALVNRTRATVDD
jgi:two-component system response regulator MtrA